MDRSEFKYFRCINCKKIIIVPLKTIDNLGHMCSLYNEIETCCDKPKYLWGNVQKGLTSGSIKESDLPEALREKTTVKFEEILERKRMIVTKGDKRASIEVDGENVKIWHNGRCRGITLF